MQWKHSDSPVPKKFRTQPSAKKVMATIFWDCDGILLIDYLPKNTTMSGQYYANLIKLLRESIKEKRRGKLSKGILLLHDNAAVHTAEVSETAIREANFVKINHPPYSPDLAPSDFFLFSKLKKELRGRRYDEISDVTQATEAYFNRQEKKFFLDGILSLKSRFEKCIELKGQYVEK